MHNMKIAVFGDTHFPFHDQAKMDAAIQLVAQLKPDAVIQIGDVTDQFAFSKYPRDIGATGLTPQQQSYFARQAMFQFWADVKKKMPKARRFQLLGNHDVRLVKRIQEQAPELAFIADDWLKQYFTIPGVHLVPDQFELDGIMFMHGYKKAGDHARYNGMSTITGHVHKARIEYFQNAHGSFWEFNVGWLGDRKSAAFAYRSQKKIDDTHTGVGFVDRGNPRFYSL